jgi:hypothetical protein
VQGDATVVREHDLGAALRGIPDEARGWQAERTSVQCQSCKAISVFDSAKVSQRCDFCGSTALVPYQQVKDAFRPNRCCRSGSPKRRRATSFARGTAASGWRPTPSRFARSPTPVKGLYLPYWTFDASAYARWTADAGTYYWVRENGKQVQKVRWTPASGELSHFFDDDLVCASRGVDPQRLRGVEPFPTEGLVAYDRTLSVGWTWSGTRLIWCAAARSREQMESLLRQMCADEVPAILTGIWSSMRPSPGRPSSTSWRRCWLLTYVYGARSFQVRRRMV